MKDRNEDNLVPHSLVKGLMCEKGLENFDLEKALYGHSLQEAADNGAAESGESGESCERNLMETLAPKIEIIKKGYIFATVKLSTVHCRTTPVGYMLNGGTSLALAECLAGTGSMLLVCDDPSLGIVGTNVSGNHTNMARLGETLRIYAECLNEGKSSHLWLVSFYNEKDELVSESTVTNVVLRRK